MKNLFFAIIAFVFIVTSSVSSTAGVNVPKFPMQKVNTSDNQIVTELWVK